MTDIHLFRLSKSGNDDRFRDHCGLPGQPAAHPPVTPLTGVPPVAPGTVYGINLMLTGQPVLIQAPRLPGCPACGQTGPKIPS